jgi:hypothetical protein
MTLPFKKYYYNKVVYPKINCENCGKEFTPKRRGVKYCCVKCRNIACNQWAVKKNKESWEKIREIIKRNGGCGI